MLCHFLERQDKIVTLNSWAIEGNENKTKWTNILQHDRQSTNYWHTEVPNHIPTNPPTNRIKQNQTVCKQNSSKYKLTIYYIFFIFSALNSRNRSKNISLKILELNFGLSKLDSSQKCQVSRQNSGNIFNEYQIF